MTVQVQRFPYREINPALGAAGSLPYMPLQLEHQGNVVPVSALVDSGSSLNVIPYDIGIQLGAIWDRQTIRVPLTGALTDVEARGILLTANIDGFAPVRLAFAWSRSNSVPVILGQVNFFTEFDVCFHRSQSWFEIKLKESTGA